MKTFLTTLAALGAFCALAACESAGGQYDGVSRFAGGERSGRERFEIEREGGR